MSTLRTFAISTNVSMVGCFSFVRHRETVDSVFPNCAANHLLVNLFSTRITLILFIAFSGVFIHLLYKVIVLFLVVQEYTEQYIFCTFNQ